MVRVAFSVTTDSGTKFCVSAVRNMEPKKSGRIGGPGMAMSSPPRAASTCLAHAQQRTEKERSGLWYLAVFGNHAFL